MAGGGGAKEIFEEMDDELPRLLDSAEGVLLYLHERFYVDGTTEFDVMRPL